MINLMKIIMGKPEPGRRSLICRGDEAKVTRLSSGRMEGLVERISHVNLADFSIYDVKRFTLKSQWGNIDDGIFNSIEPGHHVMKFLAHGYARVLFPENFPRFHEFRAHCTHPRFVYSSYSDYVPDSTGTIERKTRDRKKFYEHADGYPIKIRAIQFERIVTPGLADAIEKISRAGIIIDHPEANYHVHDGKIVFFDIDGISMNPRQTENHEALSILGAMCAFWVMFKTNYRTDEFDCVMAFLSHSAQQMPVILGDLKQLRFMLDETRRIGGPIRLLDLPEAPVTADNIEPLFEANRHMLLQKLEYRV